MSHAAAYKHFKNKNALLETIALKGFNALNQAFEEISAKSLNKIQSLGKAYIEFGLKNPGYYRVMFAIQIESSTLPELQGSCFKSFHFLVDAMGERNKANISKAIYAWSLVHGFVMLMLDGQTGALTSEYHIEYRKLEALCLEMTDRVISQIF